MFQKDEDVDFDEDFLKDVFCTSPVLKSKHCNSTSKNEEEGLVAFGPSEPKKLRILPENAKINLSSVRPTCSPSFVVNNNFLNDISFEDWDDDDNDKKRYLDKPHKISNETKHSKNVSFCDEEMSIRIFESPKKNVKCDSSMTKNLCNESSVDTNDIFNKVPNFMLNRDQNVLNRSSGFEVKKFPGYSTPISSKSFVKRQRKFPGPAGLLPDRLSGSLGLGKLLANEENEGSENQIILTSQSSQPLNQSFQWTKMLQDYNLDSNNDSDPLKTFSISWVKNYTIMKQTSSHKIPFLAASLKAVDCSSADPCVLLQDCSGEIRGTLHRDAWAAHGLLMNPGTVLVLQNVGILNTGTGSRRHYLNITIKNILAIYSERESTTLQNVPHSMLLSRAQDFLSKSNDLPPETSSENVTLFSGGRQNAKRSTMINSPAPSGSRYNFSFKVATGLSQSSSIVGSDINCNMLRNPTNELRTNNSLQNTRMSSGIKNSDYSLVRKDLCNSSGQNKDNSVSQIKGHYNGDSGSSFNSPLSVMKSFPAVLNNSYNCDKDTNIPTSTPLSKSISQSISNFQRTAYPNDINSNYSPLSSSGSSFKGGFRPKTPIFNHASNNGRSILKYKQENNLGNVTSSPCVVPHSFDIFSSSSSENHCDNSNIDVSVEDVLEGIDANSFLDEF